MRRKDLDVKHTQVLAYRHAAHDLAGGGDGQTVLATGIQDYPPGRSAALALRLRTGSAPDPPPGQSAPPAAHLGSRVLVHSIRGALHLHRAADLPGLAAALLVEDVRDMPPQTIGPFGAEIAAEGIALDAALGEVAAAMREAAGDGKALTKGELSGAVSPRVDPRLAPWCATCGVNHVQDMLFRLATLQAGLVVEVDPESSSQLRYRPADPPAQADRAKQADQAESRARLVRDFLAAFGPAQPAHLAAWLGQTTTAARRWWSLVADELQPATIEGGKYWAHADHIAALEKSPKPQGVRLLPPYDPLTELADRQLLAPDPAHRKAVWRAAANPGVVLADGEIAGVWRQRRTRDQLALRVEPFAPLSAAQRRAAESDAATIAAYNTAAAFDLIFE